MKAADACDDDFAWIDDEFLAHNVVELHQIADGAVFRFGAKSRSFRLSEWRPCANVRYHRGS